TDGCGGVGGTVVLRFGAPSPARPPCVVRHARRGRVHRRVDARADGFADTLRHTPAEPVRLALVLARLDANNRCLPPRRACGRLDVWPRVTGRETTER